MVQLVQGHMAPSDPVSSCVQSWSNLMRLAGGESANTQRSERLTDGDGTSSRDVSSHPLDVHAIAGVAMGISLPTQAEQAAFHSAIDEMWQAAEVGYEEHLKRLLQRHSVPADFQHPLRSNTLLMVAVNVRTSSQHYDRDLAAVLRMLLRRGALLTQTEATGMTPVHVLVAQPSQFLVAARLKALLCHIIATSGMLGNPLEQMNHAGETPEDMAVGLHMQQQLKRIRVMIRLKSCR